MRENLFWVDGSLSSDKNDWWAFVRRVLPHPFVSERSTLAFLSFGRKILWVYTNTFYSNAGANIEIYFFVSAIQLISSKHAETIFVLES